ncbi:MAG: alpha/beta fold hydrolase [Chthoniobacterales bacterium]
MIRRSSALAADSAMCALINVLQARHRLDDRARSEMEQYVSTCEGLTIHDYYGHIEPDDLPPFAPNGRSMSWRSPLPTAFEANNTVHVDLFPCSKGWSGPTVFMLHALMSATRVGYRRWAAHFNGLGWNVCFVHLPYHYSRVPPGFFNGELAITANLMRNAEGLRQSVMELRQLISALRAQGCTDFGILGTSYGAWIGALLACVEPDLRFAALMAPIVNVEHAIWQSPAAFYMRRELRRANIEPALVARHFHLSSPSHNLPVCGAERVLFVAGEFDLIARAEDIRQLYRKWQGSELLVVPQGHFGYRMMRETVSRLQQRGWL